MKEWVWSQRIGMRIFTVQMNKLPKGHPHMIIHVQKENKENPMEARMRKTPKVCLGIHIKVVMSVLWNIKIVLRKKFGKPS
jgi:hypothetical protein